MLPCPPRPRRCIVQLSILGYILVPIFLANRWWLTLLYSLFMLAVAAIEAVSRPAQTYAGMLPQVGGQAGSLYGHREAGCARHAEWHGTGRSSLYEGQGRGLHCTISANQRLPPCPSPGALQVLLALGLAASLVISYGLAVVVQVG